MTFIETPAIGSPKTPFQLLLARAERQPDDPYLQIDGSTFTYAQLADRAARLGAGLSAAGVRHGEPVAAVLGNTLEAVVLFFGLNAIGAIDVQVNPSLRGEMLRHQLDDVAARVLVLDAELAPHIDDVRRSLPHLQQVFLRGEMPAHATLGLPHRSVEELSASAAPIPGNPSLLEDDACTIVYTGGTTGPSKGCVISNSYALQMGADSARCAGMGVGETLWTPLALYHINAKLGSLIGTLLAGGVVSIARRFSVSRFWDDIARARATRAKLIGSMFVLIAQAADTPTASTAARSLEYAIGAPMTQWCADVFWNRWRVKRISPVYGMTEAAMITTIDQPTQRAPAGSSGHLNENFDIRIVTETGATAEVDEVGEVLVRPRRPGVMFSGYWRDRQSGTGSATSEWFSTGDLGRVDSEGWFYFHDRKADHIRRRGENISSVELESILHTHPEVLEAAVHAVPSELGEDDVKIVLVRRPGSTLTEPELFGWCASHLPSFARPRYVEFRDALPKNSVGRVLRAELRSEGVTDRTWQPDEARPAR